MSDNQPPGPILRGVEPPSLRVEFYPPSLPSGLIGQRDLTDFVSGLQLLLVRDALFRSLDAGEGSNLDSILTPYQTLLVVPSSGSFLGELLPVIQGALFLYDHLHPVLVAHQQNISAMGSAFLWAGQNFIAGAFQALGALALQGIIKDSGRGQSQAKSDELSRTGGGHHEAGQSPQSTDPNSLLLEMAGVARGLNDFTRSLGMMLQGERESLDRITGDEPSKTALKKMLEVTNRSDLRAGSVSVRVTEKTIRTFHIEPAPSVQIDAAVRREITPKLKSNVAERPEPDLQVEAPMLIGDPTLDVWMGIIRRVDYQRLTLYLEVPPRHELFECMFPSELVPTVAARYEAGNRVLVSGLVYRQGSRSRGQSVSMQVRDLMPL